MFHKLCLLAALAIVSVVAFPATSEWTSHDLYSGETNESVLIYSDQFNGREFSWEGPNMISAYAIVNNDNGTTLFADVFGGIYRDYLRVFFVNDVNVTVYIYSRPENFYFGYNSSTGMLVSSTRFTGQSSLNVTYSGNENIRFVQMLDQTNGTGVYVAHSKGYGTKSLLVSLRSQLFQGQIDYMVNIFVEKPTAVRPPNNFEFGQLTNSSKLISTRIITVTDLKSGEYVMPLWGQTVDYANLTDLSREGNVGTVRNAVVNDDNFHVQFADYDRPNFVFQLQVFGQPRATNGSIIVGEIHPDSVRLLDERVYETGTTTSFVWGSPTPIDRIEVVGVGQASMSVRAKLIVGEVGGQSLVVLFEAIVQQQIHFTVRVYCRPEMRMNTHPLM